MKIKVPKFFSYITQLVLLACFRLRKIYKPSLLSSLKVENLKKKSVYSPIVLVIFLVATALMVSFLGTKTTYAVGVTKYPVIAGGNWSADATWTLNADGTANATVKPTASDDVIMNATSGPVTIDAASVAKTVTCTGYTNTLTHNAFILTVSGNITFVSGMTYTPLATSTVVMAATGTLTTGTKLMPLVKNTVGTMVLGDNLSFMASKVMVLTISGTAIDLAGKTVSGNSNINRVLVTSGTLGTAKTITVSAGTFANADFRDISFANGGADLNLSAITGKSGDCGGNSMSGGGTLTFTTAVPKFWVGNGGSWSDPTNHWATSSNGAPSVNNIPLPQDDVFFDSHSFIAEFATVTGDMPRLGRSIDWTGAAYSPTWSITVNATNYGSLTLISAMTALTSNGYIMEGRGSYTLTSTGASLGAGGSFVVQMVGGTLTLQNSFISFGSYFSILNGTFNANGFNITASRIRSDGTATRAIKMGSGTWTAAYIGSAVWLWSSTGLTLDKGTSTIVLSQVDASGCTFTGGGNVYNNISITGGGTGAVIFTGSNTFNNFTIGAPKTVTFTHGTTQIINGNFIAVGTAGNIITINSDSGTLAATLSKTSGIAFVDYTNVNWVNVTGGSWYYGQNATITNSTGWTGAKIWDGGGGADTNWSTAANWTGDVIPTNTDDVYFTGTTTNATVDSSFTNTIKSLNLTSTYANTSVLANDLTVSGDVNIAGGTFSPVSHTVNVGGNWTLTAGTFTAGTSFISLTNTSATAKTFAGGGKTYNNLSITGGGTGAWTFSGSNAFNNIVIGAPKTVTFTHGTTQTINGNFTAVGTAGNIITINSDIAGAAATLSKASGFVSGDYLSIKDSSATGGATWYAGPLTHSTDVSGNSGWIFINPKIISNAGGNWNDAGTWVDGVVPTAADNVFATATSGNLTISANAFCRNIDLTNYTGILTHNSNVILSVGNATGGSLKFVAGMTYILGDSITSVINFVSTTTGNTLSWGGKSVGSLVFNGVGGDWRLLDTTTINGNLEMDAGTLRTDCVPFSVAGSQIINGGTIVDSQSAYDYFKLSIGSATHNDYGAAYPVTYSFHISPNSSNLKVYKRYNNSQVWSQIPEETSSDFFNGIEAVRFDYPNNQAYISVAFSDASDEIYLKITNGSGNNVCANYSDIPDYYDNRTAAVTVTSDDWATSYDGPFQAAADALRLRHIWFSAGINTNNFSGSIPNWAVIQNEINAGYVEPASHSRTHPSIPYLDYDSEIGGSRDDLINNLDFPALNKKGNLEYVYAWIEPFGTADATVRSKLGQYKYLADRSTGDADSFATWDAINNVYGRIGTSYNYSSGNLIAANAKFDAVISAGGIYHLWGHPYMISWTPGSWILDHLDHIKEKTNLWYVGFGQLYLYHYLDDQNKVSVAKTTFSSAPSSATATALTSDSIKIDWTSGGSQNKFNIYRDGPSGSGTLVHSANDLTYTDAGLNPSTTYTYYVYSVNNDNIENPSFVSTTATTATPTSSESATPSGTTATPSLSRRLFPWVTGVVTSSSASFTTIPTDLTNIEVGQTITFDASLSGSNIVKYEWDFGDGTTSNEMKVDHKYDTPGRYTVTLTTTDKSGNTSTVSKTIDIRPPAPTITNVKADGTSIVFEGKSFPKATVNLTIHSNPYAGKTVADDKDGKFSYTLEKGSDTIGEGGHTVLANATIILSDSSELTSKDSKTYDFNVSVDNGKLKVEMGKTKTWQYISLGLGLLLVIGIGFVLIRARKRRKI